MGEKCQEMDKFAILVGWGGIPKKMGGGGEKEIKILWKIGNDELVQRIILSKRTLISLWVLLAYHLFTL